MEFSSAEIIKKVFDYAQTRQMHVDDMAEMAIKVGLSGGLEKEKLSQKFAGFLAGHVKSKEPEFSRVKGRKKGSYKRGYYALKRKREFLPVVDVEQTEMTSFTGKAGEYGVLSELMFREYHATIFPIDKSLDIIATKNNKYFHIQVKTSTASEDESKFNFTIKKSAFDAANFSQTFYILCLRRPVKKGNIKEYISEYLIFNNVEIRRMIDEDVIADGNSHSIRISISSGSYILNNNKNVNWNKSNFAQIA